MVLAEHTMCPQTSKMHVHVQHMDIVAALHSILIFLYFFFLDLPLVDCVNRVGVFKVQ